MARLSFRCDEELVRRVDAERGLIPREAWLRRAVERALVDDDGGVRGRLGSSTSGSPDQPPAPAEQPEPIPDEEFLGQLAKPDWKTAVSAPFGARSSVQAKRDVRPIPKAGK